MEYPATRTHHASNQVFCVIALMVALAGNGSAQTVLIGAGVRNGDFNADTSPDDQESA